MNPGISEIIPFAPQWTFSKQDFQQSLTILFFSKGLCSLFRVQMGRNYSTFLTSSLHIKDMLYHHYPTKGSFLICCSMQEVKNKLAAFCKPTLLRIDKGESWFAFLQQEQLHYTLGINLPGVLWHVSNLMLSANILIFPLHWFEQIRWEINYKNLRRFIYTNPPFFSFFFLFSRAFLDQSVFLLYTSFGQDSCTTTLGKCVLFCMLAEKWKVRGFFFSYLYGKWISILLPANSWLS